MEQRIPVGTIICALVVLIACFLPWWTLPAMQFPNMEGPLGETIELGSLKISVKGYQGFISPLGVKIPNWLLVVVAVAVPVIGVLRERGIWEAPAATGIGLAVYGLLHTGIFLLAFLPQGRPAIGAVATLAAFIGLVILTIREFNENAA